MSDTDDKVFERYPLGLSLRHHIGTYVEQMERLDGIVGANAQRMIDEGNEEQGEFWGVVRKFNQAHIEDMKDLLRFVDAETNFYDGAGSPESKRRLLRIVAGVRKSSGAPVVQICITADGKEITGPLFNPDQAEEIAQGLIEAAAKARGLSDE